MKPHYKLLPAPKSTNCNNKEQMVNELGQMIYTEEQLTMIADLAEIFISVPDIAAAIDVDPDILKRDIRDSASPACKAYQRGKLTSKIELHKQEMNLAKSGSPLGLESVNRHLLDMEESELI